MIRTFARKPFLLNNNNTYLARHPFSLFGSVWTDSIIFLTYYDSRVHTLQYLHFSDTTAPGGSAAVVAGGSGEGDIRTPLSP